MFINLLPIRSYSDDMTKVEFLKNEEINIDHIVRIKYLGFLGNPDFDLIDEGEDKPLKTVHKTLVDTFYEIEFVNGKTQKYVISPKHYDKILNYKNDK